MANHVGFGKYSELLRTPNVRRVVVLGLVIRIPLWAANIALVLHVVSHLNRSYVDAGLVAGVSSLALAISGPWRGRRLDQRGLRATVGPALVIEAVCWAIAPWVSFWPLVFLVLVAGLFVVPSFSIVRQVMIAAVPLKQRTAALSMDAVAVELSFMIGPVVGVLIATSIPTPIALMVCQFASIGGSLVLWWMNPPLQAPGGKAESRTHVPYRSWLTPSVVMILVLTIASTIVLNAEDLGIVAALRAAGHSSWIGWELALWGGGSAVGGLIYGAAHRHPPASWMLLGLGVSTALVAIAPNLALFTVLLTISGIFCAPTITATVDSLSRVVPESVRGEAIGWHGSALTVGGAIAAPIIGAMLDAHGWGSGFVLGGAIGAAVAVAALVLLRENRRAVRAAAGSALDVESGEDLAGGLAAVERVEVQPRGAGG